MENCEITISDEMKLTIVVDLGKEVGFTQSRRSVCIGSSQGNVDLWHEGKALGIKANINVFRKITKEERARGRVSLKGWDSK